MCGFWILFERLRGWWDGEVKGWFGVKVCWEYFGLIGI